MSQQNIPQWLDANFFENILRKNLRNTSVKVENLKIEPCAGEKDGFLSTLYRVHVNFWMNSKNEFESFVVKMVTNQEFALDKIGAKGFDVQNKEMKFFEIIAPQMEKVLKRIDGGKDVFVKVVAVDRKQDVIVFEDLKQGGFVMPEKSTGLDEKQIKLALTKLAMFHAASLVLQGKRQKVFDDFDVGFFSRKITVFNNTFMSIFGHVVEEVATWPGFENYAEKLEKLKPNFIENATRCFDVKSGDFCVLNHGDIWKNNLMFKNGENGEVEDVILVKF